MRGNLEGAGAGHKASVVDSSLHCHKPITRGILDLIHGVLVGATDEDSAAFSKSGALYEGELVVTELVLVYSLCVPEALGLQVVHRVHLAASAREHETFHISALGASQSDAALLG
jgi:hypothetical protein